MRLSTEWIKGDARFGEGGEKSRYRYRLERELYPVLGFYRQRSVGAFIMLNPSMATATEDDPTIRRCIGYALSLGWEKLIIGNVYALRATDPKALDEVDHDEAIGPENDQALKEIGNEAETIICAWGDHCPRGRAETVVDLFDPTTLYALHTNKSGMPSHPLYLKKTAEPFPWSLK